MARPTARPVCGFRADTAAMGMCLPSLASIPFLLMANALATALAGQGPTWASPQLAPDGRSAHAAAYDEGRGRLVVFGGDSASGPLNDTWEHDGSSWIRRTPAVSPPASTTSTMAYDPVRGEMWLATGLANGTDVWRWDGENWAQGPSLPPLAVGSLTTRRRLIWHGGTNPGLLTWDMPFLASPYVGTTWRFDGTSWVTMATYGLGGGPGPGSNDIPAAYVPATGRTYVLGGGMLAWNGTTWQGVTSNSSPGNGNTLSMAWDAARARFIANNSTTPGTVDASVGELLTPLQVQWATVTNQIPAPLNTICVHLTAKGATVLHGGRALFGQYFADLFVADITPSGLTWQLVPPPGATPSARVYTEMTYEASTGRMVLFGGQSPFGGAYADTWTFDGTTWFDHGPSGTVSPRTQPALCSSPSLGTVLFGGGIYPTSYFNDTWFLQGTQWLPTILTGAPSPRMGHDMVWAGGWNRMVMFGGYNGSTLGDTWSLAMSPTGLQWTQMFTPGAVPVRQSHAMAYDARRNVVVVFGGADVNGHFLGDTWELVPQTLGWQWVPRTPAQSPPRRWAHKMDYDPARGVVVMTGGYGNPQCGEFCASHLNDVWEYDGDTWRQRLPGTALPAGREGAGFAYDSLHQRFVMQGGGNGGFPSETWFYTAPNDTFGQGMQGGSTLRLRCTRFPIAGQPTGFAFDSPFGFGWLTVFVGPAPQAGLTLGPGLLCGTGTFYGVPAVVTDAMGSPGTASFQLPASMIGQGLVTQGIALDAGMCLRLTDPLAVTIHGP